MSIRLRLTLLYSAILAFTLLVLGGAVIMGVSRVTLAVVEQTLAAEANHLITSSNFKLDHIGYRASRIAAPQTYVQTITHDGAVADRTANLGDFVLPLSEDGWKTCSVGEPWTEVVPAESGRLLVYSTPLEHGSQMTGIVQVARSLVEYDQAINALRGILVSGSLLATLAAFGAGWVLAGPALRPIDRITQTARAIGTERDFGRRLQHAGPNDEVGRLTTTLNDMLQELQLAYQHVEQALQAQRRFVADASHELRTPLTTLRGNLGLLEREPPISSEDRGAVLADMVEECDRLMRLTNSLLALARADGGQVLAGEPVALDQLLGDACRQANLLAPGRDIRCQAAAGVVCMGNRDALKQVLLILIDNALKHTPPEGVITVGSAAENGMAVIRVQDSGPGITPEALPHIFDRFYRVEAARPAGGAGLGLAIAKELVERQHGSLTVDSQLGHGATFRVQLPLAAPRGRAAQANNPRK